MGRVDMFVAEFGGFFEAFFLKGNGADLAKEPQLAKANGAVGEGFVLDTANYSQGNGQVDAGFIDV